MKEHRLMERKGGPYLVTQKHLVEEETINKLNKRDGEYNNQRVVWYNWIFKKKKEEGIPGEKNI